ncbi:hypothetical protein [Deinococcus aquaedulcis]|uniref:hypothetical protein n=1 Tax=Deinococcus aquaedulcis TaxID=2840455 RepID=UPI001C83EFAF|nr:hypothetical protein [Deinococcus aquaedulcis]
MAITQVQQQALIDAYTLGHPDARVAALAGISLSTVKRYRSKLGLTTRNLKARRARFGEQFVATQACRLGLHVSWREEENGPFDLRVEGLRIDVKTAAVGKDGKWRFRLNRERSSFHNRYRYRKNYAVDCDVVALVCLQPSGEAPEVYFLASGQLPTDVRIKPGGRWEAYREAWELFRPRLPQAA